MKQDISFSSGNRLVFGDGLLSRRFGFTLIELLVVVSIISLLVSILLPALSKARNQAQKGVCLSNTRQMAIATQTFAVEHDGVIPSFSGTPESVPAGSQLGGSRSIWYCWIGQLEPAITGKALEEANILRGTSGYSHKIWWCPSDKVSPKSADYPWWGGVSYGITSGLYNQNGYPAYNGGNQKDGAKIDRLAHPASKLYVSEHGKSQVLPPSPHMMYVPVVTSGESLYTFEDYLVVSYFGALGNYHPGQTNTVFLDGHAESVAFASLAGQSVYSSPAWAWNDWSSALVDRIPR